MPGPWTDSDDTRLRQLHDEGVTLSEAARRMSRAKATVSRRSTTLGLSWDREQTRAATAARRDDAKARRAAIILRLYGRAEADLDRLEGAKWKTLVPSGPGFQSPDELDFIPPADERNVAQSLTQYLTAAARLEQVDADTGTNGSQVDAWLDHVAGGPLTQDTNGA